MENTITYVAMDTHKKEHKVAFNYPGKEVIENITIRNTACEMFSRDQNTYCDIDHYRDI